MLPIPGRFWEAYIQNAKPAGYLPLWGLTLEESGNTLTDGYGERRRNAPHARSYASEETSPSRIAYRTKPGTS